MVRVFANVPGDQGSILGRHTKEPKNWYLMPPRLTLSIYKVRIKGKVEQSRER